MGRRTDKPNEMAQLRAQLASLERERQQLFEWVSSVERERAALATTLPMAAHQLLAPLQAMLLGTDVLGTRARSEEPVPRAWLLEHADKMRRQLERLDALMRAAIEIWRGELRDLEPRGEADLVDSVRTVVAAHADEADAVGCRVTVTAPPSLVGPWDANKLRFVVAGLVSNAIKHGRGAPVQIDLVDGGTRVTLRVSDAGPGFSAEAAAQLFRPFSRIGDAEGFGLGLWIVHQLTVALGGTITAAAVPGKGAVFTVVLRKSVHAASARRRPRRGVGRARKKELPR